MKSEHTATGTTWVTLERRVLALGATVFFLLAGGPAGLNPDGLEMIAMGRGWIGLGPDLPAGGYWPPLWAALVTLPAVLPDAWFGSATFSDGIAAGRLLNLLLAGAIALPLHHVVSRIGGPAAARLAVLLYVLLPAVREHAVVLDARVLGSVLALSCLSWAVEAHFRAVERAPLRSTSQAWVAAGVAAALAGLTRPEAMLFPLLLASGAVASAWQLRSPVRAAAQRALLLLAAALPGLLRPGAELRAWESYAGPWLGIWPSRDLVALFGANSAPTGYREFVLDASEAGLGSPPLPLENFLAGLPAGLSLLRAGLPAATGALLLVLAVLGGLVLLRAPRLTPRVVLPGFGILLLPILVLPQARDQPTTSTNLIYFVPVLCAAAAIVLSPPMRTSRVKSASTYLLSLLIGLACIAEAHLGPYRAAPPSFHKGTDIAETMRLFLNLHPPASGRVAATLSTRGIVFRADLEPIPLPSGWEPWDAPPGAGVLVSSMDLRGADGGRGRALIEDPAWTIRYITFEDELSAWSAWVAAEATNRPPPTLHRHAHWLLYLERREPGASSGAQQHKIRAR